eukprot:m.176925 g.176925  ORF g.176925 m.176925 type:complete len:121 (-) comp24468_c1_seq2:342-704(-)
MWGGEKGATQGKKKQLCERLILRSEAENDVKASGMTPTTLRSSSSTGSPLIESRFKRTKNLIGMLSRKALGQKNCAEEVYTIKPAADDSCRSTARASPFLRRRISTTTVERRRKTVEKLL